MSTAASAVTTVDSAATQQEEVQQQEVQTPAAPEFDATDQSTWSRGQRDNWNKTGAQPTKADSAPAKKDSAASSDSATDKDKKNAADNASDSATDTDGKPRRKDKEDTAKRFEELLELNKSLRQRLEVLETGKGSGSRDGKQESQTAAETYEPLDEKEYFKANPKATYEDFVRAAGKHEGIWAARQEIALDSQRREQAAQQQKLAGEVEAAKQRYPDWEQRVKPAADSIMSDKGIADPIKAMIGSSRVFVDVMYVLSEPKALADFISTARSNPAEAIRKLVLTEQLVITELAKAKGGKKDDAAVDDKGDDGKTRDATGKFVSDKEKSSGAASETKPRAPKPVSEVGGRGTASEDPLVAAAKAGSFRNFDAEMNRRRQAQHSR